MSQQYEQYSLENLKIAARNAGLSLKNAKTKAQVANLLRANNIAIPQGTPTLRQKVPLRADQYSRTVFRALQKKDQVDALREAGVSDNELTDSKTGDYKSKENLLILAEQKGVIPKSRVLSPRGTVKELDPEVKYSSGDVQDATTKALLTYLRGRHVYVNGIKDKATLLKTVDDPNYIYNLVGASLTKAPRGTTLADKDIDPEKQYDESQLRGLSTKTLGKLLTKVGITHSFREIDPTTGKPKTLAGTRDKQFLIDLYLGRKNPEDYRAPPKERISPKGKRYVPSPRGYKIELVPGQTYDRSYLERATGKALKDYADDSGIYTNSARTKAELIRYITDPTFRAQQEAKKTRGRGRRGKSPPRLEPGQRYTREQLKSFTIGDIRTILKDAGISPAGKTKKDDLIDRYFAGGAAPGTVTATRRGQQTPIRVTARKTTSPTRGVAGQFSPPRTQVLRPASPTRQSLPATGKAPSATLGRLPVIRGGKGGLPLTRRL